MTPSPSVSPHKTLPRRVRESIKDLQYRSEILVAVVQLAVIFLLFVLYTVAPTGHTPDAPVRSAALGLSLFSILVLLRLWFAWTRQLTPIVLGFSVVAEMATLIFTIWTYHLQFETVAAADLKNPYFSYVFTLITLRALRFEPAWVVLSGLTAAAGWGLVLWNAINTADMNIVTWDYVSYVSSMNLHPGGEFTKILSILLVTVIIALVLERANRTLLQAVSQSQAAEDLARFFDREVVEKITKADDQAMAGHAERRDAAVMFVDMRGFTPASKTLSANDLIALLGEYQALVVPIIKEHGGSIDKFLGDGILASFGAVQPSNTYAANALSAGLAIMKAANDWQSKREKEGMIAPSVGLALASGEIVFGVIGHKDRLEYTVLGDAVNLAAKLEKHTKEEKVKSLSDLTTYNKAHVQGFEGELEIRENRAVAGVDEPISLAVIA